MKPSDLEQSPRILRLIDQLTAEELSSVEIVNDNPEGEGPNDCAIGVKWYAGMGHPLADEDGFAEETCRGPSLFKCLQEALVVRGMVEKPLPQTPEQAEETRMFAASVAILAVMRHLWRSRQSYQAVEKAFEPHGDSSYSQLQAAGIRAEMAIAEQALRPILERLAGYSWESLPESIKELCRQGGIIQPEAWTA